MRDKRKVRVDFRKNREKTTRLGNLARQVGDDASANDNVRELAKSERVSGKGRLSRRRTIIAADGSSVDGSNLVRDIDVSKCVTGRVLSSAGLTTIVRAADGRRFDCTVRRVLRTMSRDQRNVVVPGDEVLFQPTNVAEGVIERVNPRRGVLSRGSQNREHIIVANIDQVGIVVSAGEPGLKPHLIDRLLVCAERERIQPLICITKIDLVEPHELQPLIGVYARMGYEVLPLSIHNGTNLETLRDRLSGRRSVVVGQSGVGKSSLLNAVESGLNLRVGAVSEESQ